MRKRLLPLLLALLTPTFAVSLGTTGSQVPLVLLGGDGDTLYDKDGNYLFQIDDLGHLVDGSDKQELLRSVANVLQPFLLQHQNLDYFHQFYMKDIHNQYIQEDTNNHDLFVHYQLVHIIHFLQYDILLNNLFPI